MRTKGNYQAGIPSILIRQVSAFRAGRIPRKAFRDPALPHTCESEDLQPMKLMLRTEPPPCHPSPLLDKKAESGRSNRGTLGDRDVGAPLGTSSKPRKPDPPVL